MGLDRSEGLEALSEREARERTTGYRMPAASNEAANCSNLCEARGLRTFGIYHGEFDPGSERTLAACLKHASRAARGSNTP